MTIKPMRASKVTDVSLLRWPMFGSPKMDGIRCVVLNGVAYSKKMKPLPNQHLQSWAKLNKKWLQSMDGELTIGGHDNATYNRSMSGIMSRDGTPDFVFTVFDMMGDGGYTSRLAELKRCLGWISSARVKLCPMKLLQNEKTMHEYEADCLAKGYEGIMLRNRDGIYKFGTSTMREQYLLKLKRFDDDEAVIVGYKERMHNTNEATINEVGQVKRSSAKAGKVGRGDLGALVCVWNGVQFEIGGGYDDAERARLWSVRETLPGQHVKFKYQPAGVKEAPRFPQYLGLRHPDDME